MAVIVQLLLAFVLTTAWAAEPDCDCGREVEAKALWAYLVNLSEESDSSTDKASHSVLPAVLSPLVDCDCEKYRQKRKIMPDVPVSETKNKKNSKKKSTEWHKKKNVNMNDSRCPRKHARVGERCVKYEDLLDI